MSAQLDYEIVPDGHGAFLLWTPDNTGAVIGSGCTETEAMLDAIHNMASLQQELIEKMKSTVPFKSDVK